MVKEWGMSGKGVGDEEFSQMSSISRILTLRLKRFIRKNRVDYILPSDLILQFYHSSSLFFLY